MHAAILGAIVVVVSTMFVGCRASSTSEPEQDTLYFVGEARADVRVTKSPGLPRRITKTIRYESGVEVQTKATLDQHGWVVEAEQTRTKGDDIRRRRLMRRAMGWVLEENERVQPISAANASSQNLVLIEFLDEVGREGPATFVDLTAGEIATGSLSFVAGEIRATTSEGARLAIIDATGSRIGPGAFALAKNKRVAQPTHGRWQPVRPPVKATRDPSLTTGTILINGLNGLAVQANGNGQQAIDKGGVLSIKRGGEPDRRPPTSSDTRPTLAFESDADSLRRLWPRKFKATATQDALFAVEQIHALVTPTLSGSGSPSALRTLTNRTGDCDDATALFVGWMRAHGHAARAAVGYRLQDDVATPHAWGEFWTGTHWSSADAMFPQVGTIPSNVRLFDGLGSPFTMGRALGVVSLARVGPAK